MYVFRDIKHEHSFFVILDHFLPFCPTIDPKIKTWRNYHFTNVYHKWQSYQVWFLSYGVRQTEFFVIFNHFLPFYFPNNLENQNFEKMKLTPADIIILKMCTITCNHMMHGSWDMEHNQQNFLSFWRVSSPFTTHNNQKIKILKKWKKGPEILLLECNLEFKDSTQNIQRRALLAMCYPERKKRALFCQILQRAVSD